MDPINPRTRAALDAALGNIAATAASAAARTVELLGGIVSSAVSGPERETARGAQADLRRQVASFCNNFDLALREKVMQEVNPRERPARQLASTNWQSLSLVDNDEVEKGMFSDRIAQGIGHECEWELLDLAAYVSALLNIGPADQDRNPLRPEVIASALYVAIEAVSPERETRKLLARELGAVMAKGMRLCYAEIMADLKARGVQAADLTVRGVEGPGSDRVVSGYASLPRSDSQHSGSTGSQLLTSVISQLDSGRGETSARGTGVAAGSGPGSLRGGAAGSPGVADAELMSLIRRLSFFTSRPAGLGGASPTADGADSAGSPRAASGSRGGAQASGLQRVSAPGALGGGTGGLRGDGLTGLMAVNLIRAHRDELRQASSGTLDHMVIDVVGSLFDQILSDSRVPPQTARQIARLQLPVLRVALSDPSFFSSRKHPVRRFVNRIASLACAFDDFEDGPGRQFLERVRELVQEIIEGDFDQVEVYAAKLTLLEAFIEQQTAGDVHASGAAGSLLDGKESQLRVQQRYMQQLQGALAPLPMQDYLRNFLSQVWSQALAMAERLDGPTSERTQRLRRAAIDLVISVLPKDTPALRKAFLMQLPGLMKTLNEGLSMIGWPETAQREFFGQLLPAHAESLKGQAPSELDRNLFAKQLEAVFNLPLPRPEQLRGQPVAALDAAALAPHFSAKEIEQVGLVDEAAVDWNGQVDIDLSAEDGAAGEPGSGPDEPDPRSWPGAELGVDIDLSVATPDPAEPSHGPQLMDHLRVGFAYQMHLKNEWQKVRLSYVSSGRSFFVFTHGKGHQETLSLTARMLARMCETNRLRAFENSYLLERATARARKQLAALKATHGVH